MLYAVTWTSDGQTWCRAPMRRLASSIDGEVSVAPRAVGSAPGTRLAANVSAGSFEISSLQNAMASSATAAAAREDSYRVRSIGWWRTGSREAGRRELNPAHWTFSSRLICRTVQTSTARWLSTRTSCRGTPAVVMTHARMGHSVERSNSVVVSFSTTSPGAAVPSFSVVT